MNTRFDRFAKMAGDYTDAWNTRDPKAVAAFYIEDGVFAANQGEPSRGFDELTEMAAGFHASFPDMTVSCRSFTLAGNHALYAWTLEGHHVDTKNHVKVDGWEEWDLTDDMKIITSAGWFDAEEYDRQIAEGSGL